MNTPETQPPASLGAAHGSAIRDVPAACQEIPGYILDVFDGSAWITQDGQVTDKWQERGIWTTPEAAAEMMERCLSPNAEVTHPESNPKTMPKKPTQSKPSRAEQASGEGLPSTALLGLVADIRAAVGDTTGKLMQDELVEHCRKLTHSADWNGRRVEMLAHLQKHMRDPERTLVCDILANGQLLPDPHGKRYGFAATGNEHHCRTNDQAPESPNVPAGQSLAVAPGSEIPAIELSNLCSVWRGHAAQCDGDLRLALESCAMDLDRLRDSYSPNDRTQRRAPGTRIADGETL